MTISELFQQAVGKESSDVFIIAGLPLSFKINGQIIKQSEQVLTPTDTSDFINQIYELASRTRKQQKDIRVDDDFSFAISKVGRDRKSVV